VAELDLRAGSTVTASTAVDLDVLAEIQRRVLWLAVRMVAEDRVSVKPHASPVFHAIQYLLGNLDRSYLTTLRARGGLQAYPSRTKDPDDVDFSTGSVGLGAVAPLFAAVARRYVDAHFGERPRSRFIALLGDAELDEGNVWEAVFDPVTHGLGNVLWVVDFNRQSLDRVVPGVRIEHWRGQFEAAGWHVVEAKYGRRLQATFAEPGGAALRDWITTMPNEHYQSLFGLSGGQLRERFLDGAPPGVAQVLSGVPDTGLAALVTDLGGHDLASMLAAYAACDAVRDRPSVIFAYTVKGWGLPIAGNPRNHSALLLPTQIDEFRDSLGLTEQTEWDRFDACTAAGILCSQRREALRREPRTPAAPVTVPAATGSPGTRPVSTQETFGRTLVSLSRDEALAPYLVMSAPDVATSTNLAGFINRVGVFAPAERRSWRDDPVLRWSEGPKGQHIELGISEMNLFLLLGQLGLAWDLSGQPLLPVGTVYDPFVCRGLDAFIYSVYSGARFLIAGTPSGVTLAPEGGAHQSTITPSIGLELPNVTFLEPAYATAVDWLVCDALGRIASGPAETTTAVPAENGAYYIRLSTRPLDQAPFMAALTRIGEAVLRRQVLAGAYRLVDASALAGRGAPQVHLAASGAVLPEVLTAAAELADEGIAAHVVDVTSLDRLHAAWQRTLRHGIRTAATPSIPGTLRAAFPGRAPVVTVHDAASHAMAWLGSALGVPCVPLGVDQFGQSGSVAELYELHDLLPGSIVNAALAALSLG
jgi:pyruvate dehydrogenase E1 component